MTQTQPSRAASWLPVMIRLTAVGYLLFFVPGLILATTQHINALPPLFARLFNWGQGGPVSIMFSTVYVVWALFLYRSARAPLPTGCSSISTSPRTPPTSVPCSSWPSPCVTSTGTYRE